MSGKQGEWCIIVVNGGVLRRGMTGAMMGWFIEVHTRIGPKVTAGKNKVMVLNGVEGLECEVYIDGIHLGNVQNLNI